MPLHVEEAGAGPALLCLHGIGSSSAAFRYQLEALSRKRRVLAWDAPGYAGSDDPPGPPGMDGYADAVADLLSARGLRRAHVLGMSFGGVIAVRLALRHPALVRSLILADSTPGSGSDPVKAAAMRAREDDLAVQGVDRFSAARSRRLLSASASPQLVDEVTRSMAASIRLPGYGWAAAAMAETDHTPDFPKLRAPTLVLCGSEDVVCPPHVSSGIAGAVPGARMEIIDGAGHVSNQEEPDRFNELVEAFLDEVEHETAPAGSPVAASGEEPG